MTKEITLKINGTEKTFQSTKDGYFCLDEIWEDFDLKASQHPTEWLAEIGNRPVELGDVFDLSEFDSGIWANKKLTLMYAGWVDVEFFMAVIDAFEALAYGDTERASQLAANHT
jgi:hypothetical protein